MSSFLLRRLLSLLPTLLGVALITFLLMHATPGGPWDQNAEKRISDESVEAALNVQFGLNKPLFFNPAAAQQALRENQNPLQIAQALFDGQFFRYLDNLAHGNLGPSYRYRGRQVQDLLFQPDEGRAFWQNRVTMTLLLGLFAMLLALLIGIPLGIAAGLKQNTIIDHAGLIFATLGYAIPSIIMGILLIYIFSVWLNVLPVLNFEYWDAWQPWLLPALALALPTAAYIARLTRAQIIQVKQQDYIRTAHAKGLNENIIILRHILRNALIPIVTFLGPALAALITGSFIIESQFGVNGIGVLFVDSINKRDYGVILALTLFYALLVALANLAVDLLYGFFDPRLRAGRKGA
ncbi:MAG TPA: ABC transporter permease [Anaerolineae bacterium]|nr:ABC transporter permease [Anaerolineae bacterium]